MTGDGQIDLHDPVLARVLAIVRALTPSSSVEDIRRVAGEIRQGNIDSRSLGVLRGRDR